MLSKLWVVISKELAGYKLLLSTFVPYRNMRTVFRWISRAVLPRMV